MKRGNVAVAVAVAIMVMRWSVLQGAKAQGTVTCLSAVGDFAPFNDANIVVQYLRNYPPGAQVCTNSNAVCQVWSYAPGGLNVAAIICAGSNYCINNDVWGNYLNQILAECNDQNNEVQGLYELTDNQKFYLTAASCLPNCIL